MSSHVELNPDDDMLGLYLGLKAMRLASTQKTHKTGTIRIPTSTGKDFIAGKGAEDGANWIDSEGVQTPLVDTSEIDKSVEEVKKQAEDLSQKSDDMAGQITDIKGTVNGQQTKLTEFGQKLEGEITRGDTTVKSVTELKQTVTGISATVEQTAQTADAALDKASKAEQNADGIRTEVSEKYQTKDGMTDYATKSFVDQAAQSVALGVVQDYKGADGSGLATKTDISVSRTEITSEVSSKYATKDGVSEEISSKITQNNGSWELKFASKTEAKSAQDTANAANTAAADAQSRVGNLEPCIRMTSDGVRVGKRSGDSFTGASALVGTDGTFDILDEHGERMLEMSDTGLRLPVLKNNTAFKIGRYHHPTYDSDVVYIGDDYDSNVASPARIEFNRNSINLTARLLNMNLTDSRFYVNGHPMGKASDIKQSQRWPNINMQAWNFGNLGIVNILHPSGTNAHIMGNDDPTEIGRINPLNAPRDYVGCTLAAYGNTTLFAEVTPAGLVKCFTAFGGQHDWDYFTGTIVFPLTW